MPCTNTMQIKQTILGAGAPQSANFALPCVAVFIKSLFIKSYSSAMGCDQLLAAAPCSVLNSCNAGVSLFLCRYYESIQIRSGGVSSMTVLTPAQSTPLFSPLLFAALILSGAYAAVTAAFNRNYELTTYKQQGKWQLLLMWPVLVLFSKNFRQQFVSALKGEKVKVLHSMDEQPGSSSSSSSL
jgi:hypothetical protein